MLQFLTRIFSFSNSNSSSGGMKESEDEIMIHKSIINSTSCCCHHEQNYPNQRSPLQRSNLNFNNYLMRDQSSPTSLYFSESTKKQEITEKHEIFMLRKFSQSSTIVLTKNGKLFIFDDEWSEINVENEFVIDFEVSEINIFVKTRNGNIYGASVGNTWNQTGTRTPSSRLQNIELKKLVHKTDLIDVKTGYGHSYFMTYNRELYFCGNTESGQMANSSKGNTMEIKRISNDKIKSKQVKLIASGYANCLVIFQNGEGLVWGNNGSMQLGYKIPNELKKPKPLIIPTDQEIIGLATGKDLSLAMTKSHEIFVTGMFMGILDTWRKIEIEFSPESIFDAYIWLNEMYILTKGRYLM